MRPARSCEIYIDGASRGNPGPSGIGAVFFDGASQPVKQLSHHLGETTNNVAEYLALIYALQEALRDGYTAVSVKTDSELLARQLNGQYRVRDAQLRLFCGLAQHLRTQFDRCTVAHVPRERNVLADRLAGRAADQRSSASRAADINVL